MPVPLAARLAWVSPLLTIFSLLFVDHVRADEPMQLRNTGPWNMAELKKTPPSVWSTTVGVQEVYYAGERYEGKSTRIFAYYAKPEGKGPFPAMLLVHGGGGQAFKEWAELWAKRGYVALAMDTAGQGPRKERLEDGGPPQDDGTKFRPFTDDTVRDMWTYHAVAAVVRGHSLLASRPEVDKDRIGITGISWGGYLTCIVSGIDDRLKVSVPVYGCGFLQQNSCWLGHFEKMIDDDRSRWVKQFDPSQYLAGVSCPILFVNGTNDFAYPLDSYQKSYRLVPGGAQLSVIVRLPHGHQAGWAPTEIGLFVDSILKDGAPLPRLTPVNTVEGNLSATVDSKTSIKKAELHFAVAQGAWQQRVWKSTEAQIDNRTVTARVPSDRPLVAYLTVTDDRGATVSTPHVIVEK
jgi:dienelactone hydrolase